MALSLAAVVVGLRLAAPPVPAVNPGLQIVRLFPKSNLTDIAGSFNSEPPAPSAKQDSWVPTHTAQYHWLCEPTSINEVERARNEKGFGTASAPITLIESMLTSG